MVQMFLRCQLELFPGQQPGDGKQGKFFPNLSEKICTLKIVVEFVMSDFTNISQKIYFCAF